MLSYIYRLADFLPRTRHFIVYPSQKLSNFLNVIDKFWNAHPALLYAIGISLGCAAGFDCQWIYLLPGALLFFPLVISFHRWNSRLNIRLFLTLGLIAATLFYVKTCYRFPVNADEKQSTAYFSIESVSMTSNYFGKQWCYKGTLKQINQLESGRLIGKNVPCLINFPEKKGLKRPLANKDFLIKGQIKLTDSGEYRFTPLAKEPWIPVKTSFSFAELRHDIKQRATHYIESMISNPKSRLFLSGIATGEFHDREMLFEFARFGLQHILAISGFHFAIVAGIISLLLRLFVPRKQAALVLTLLLCSYFFFLGPTASIMRAWIMILIVLTGYLFEKSPIALNSLGVAVMAILLIDPLMVYRLGFQFSVVVTASILINYNWIDYGIQLLLPKRRLGEVSRMDLLNQHGYCIISFLRQSLALGIAVNLAAIPITLFYFGKFPLMSLAYNLFFPFLVSISMLLLIVGALLWPIPPLSAAVHAANNFYTAHVLNFAYHMPVTFDYYVYARIDRFEVILSFLSIIFFTAIFIREWLEKRQIEEQDFAFI